MYGINSHLIFVCLEIIDERLRLTFEINTSLKNNFSQCFIVTTKNILLKLIESIEV